MECKKRIICGGIKPLVIFLFFEFILDNIRPSFCNCSSCVILGWKNLNRVVLFNWIKKLSQYIAWWPLDLKLCIIIACFICSPYQKFRMSEIYVVYIHSSTFNETEFSFSNLVPVWILILQKFPSFKFLISTSAASQPLLQAQEEFQLRRPFEQSKWNTLSKEQSKLIIN